ncbi:MAG: DUF484 family protein [Nitrosomonadales bacterium]|nr:DUF484 family protein [Nitrosomonadales bacterium]
MRAEDIAAYLQNNPQFFETHADMLAEISLPHPHGGRTISLSERQMLTLRTNNKGLEKRLREMVEYGKENDALQDKVHRFTLTLFGARDLIGLQESITRNLREIFSVPHVALHVWKGMPPSAEVLAFADQQKPVCAHRAVHGTAGWFGESAPHLKSFAYLPLREGGGEAVGRPDAPPLHGLREGGQSAGLLILASEDANRFYPEMGTQFLQRIAEIVSAALQPRL